jgi:hypothetical protein
LNAGAGSPGGAAGGAGAAGAGDAGNPGNAPGGGAGGDYAGTTTTIDGAPGQVIITWTTPASGGLLTAAIPV